jgi:hypothetical protein
MDRQLGHFLDRVTIPLNRTAFHHGRPHPAVPQPQSPLHRRPVLALPERRFHRSCGMGELLPQFAERERESRTWHELRSAVCLAECLQPARRRGLEPLPRRTADEHRAPAGACRSADSGVPLTRPHLREGRSRSRSRSRPRPSSITRSTDSRSRTSTERSPPNWSAVPIPATLRGVIAWLKQTYCRSIGVQYMHIESLQARHVAAATDGDHRQPAQARAWLIRNTFSSGWPMRSAFEKFLWDKFKGTKTFSLDGGETLIPLLDQAIEWAAELGTKEIVMAMAHRGRLNVLYNTMGKMARQIFREDRRPASAPGLRRCEVSPRLQLEPQAGQWQEHSPVTVLQPQPPGVREPDRHGTRPGQDGLDPGSQTRARAAAS